MKFILNEEYKDQQFIVDAFKDAVYQTIPNKEAAEKMIQGKLDLLDEFDLEDIEKYINDIEFPLTVFRGLVVNGLDEINLQPKSLGINWTMDPDLFFDNSSAFSDCNFIVIGEINESQVDWPNTIQNYIYYSLKSDIVNIYPETEITLKSNQIPSKIKVVSKEELKELLQD